MPRSPHDCIALLAGAIGSLSLTTAGDGVSVDDFAGTDSTVSATIIKQNGDRYRVTVERLGDHEGDR